MREPFRNFKDKSDVLKLYDELQRKERALDKALKEIELLKRGNVKPEDTKRRSSIGSYVSAGTQQIFNFVDKENISLSRQKKEILKRLAYKADKVLRENIILQAKPPLDVIKYNNVPVRHSYS